MRLVLSALFLLSACGPDIRPGQPIAGIDTSPGIGTLIDINDPAIPLARGDLEPWPFAENVDEAFLQCGSKSGAARITVMLSGSRRRVLFGDFFLDAIPPSLLTPGVSLAPLEARGRPLCR